MPSSNILNPDLGFRAFLDRALSNRTIRYALLGPSVLSIVAQFEDIGRLCRWIVSIWEPIIQSIITFLAELSYISDYGATLIVVMIMFLPIGIMGIFDVIKKDLRDVSIVTATIGYTAGIFYISYVFDIINGQKSEDEPI